MSSSQFPFVDSGAPLTDPASDKLGRRAFAERIARQLRAHLTSQPLVVALNGECGGGKTTLKNFVRHALKNAADKSGAQDVRPLVVDVDLAELRGDTPVVARFCAEIARQAEADTAAAKKAAPAWRQLAEAFASKDPEQGVEAITPRIRETQSALANVLRELAQPFIVLTDNLERLNARDMADLLAFLAGAELANLVYFVPMRRELVVAALGSTHGTIGGDALRQHIHLELELPDAPDTLLRRQLEAALEERLSRVTFPARPRERWSEVIGAAVWPLFSTPRDVSRFVAAFSFQLGNFFDPQEQVLEVNPTDLVLLEALRMFTPTVYSDLRDTFRRRETRIVRLMSGRDEERKEVRVEIDGSVDRLPLSHRQKRAVTAALQQLVPLGTRGANGAREDWDRDLRFCSPRHVERYFHFGAVADAVPAHRLIAIARSCADREKLETLLLQAARDGMLPEVLDRLPALIQGLPENQLTIAAVVLCGLCDQIPTEAPEELESRLVRFGADLFAQVKNPLRRENIVAALLEDPSRLTGPVMLLHTLRPRSDGSAGATSTLSIEQYRRLIKSAVEKLQEHANSAALWRSREAGALIKRWWDWAAEKEPVQKWLVAQMQQPDRARTWLRSFVSASSAAPGKEVILQFEELAQYADPSAVAAAAVQANGDAIDRAAAKRLSQLVASKGTAAGFALRMVTVPLEEAA